VGDADEEVPNEARYRVAERSPAAPIDRLEQDNLLEDIERIQGRIERLDVVFAQRSSASPRARLLTSIPGLSHFGAMALASRVGRIERIPRARNLANYWGLTPGCRNSGEKTQRLGSISKAGSGMARWLLAQVAY
jgi:transposase